MLIGYARVSTEEQNESRQVEALRQKGVEKIFVDKQTGANTNRPEFKQMMEFVREGDTVITESFSRISRSTRDLLKIVDTFKSKRVEFISMKENVDTSTPQGKFMLTIFAALGESDINIRMINQGPDELNIIFGVDNKDFAEAIRVLYNSFVK